MNRQDYSDLEVVMTRHSRLMGDEKVFISKFDEATSNSPRTPAPAYVSPVSMSSSSVPPVPPIPRANLNHGHGGYSNLNAPPRREEKTILGLRKKVFILTAFGIAVLLILILGLAVGLSSGRASRSSGGPPAAGGSPTGILANSSLAATNWTDSNGIGRAAVFYQDNSFALNVLLFDSLSGGWVRRNVTASVMNSSSIPAMDVMPGTPLACATNRYQVSLYYLLKDNTVAEVYSPSPAGRDWMPGVLNSVLTPRPSRGSKLAAYWQVCSNCSDTLLLTYEGSGAIQLANMTGNQWKSMNPISRNINPGSGLSMNGFTDFNGKGATGTNTNAIRVYQTADDRLMEVLSGPLTDQRWEIGNYGRPLATGLPTKPPPEITSLSFGILGWTESLTTYLTDDGRLVSAHWNGTAWTVRPPNLDKLFGNASAIAYTQDQQVYTIINGAVHQYKVDAITDPFQWFYVNKLTE